MQKKPNYFLEGVDNALHLVQHLRDVGSLRLSDAATELGVAPSTAHRLLSMLVYRGFAVQDESKRYVPGPSLGIGPAGISWTSQLRRIAAPHLELLASRTRETVNLTIRVGAKVRFLSTVEGDSILRVGDRQGMVLPANVASGGKAMLAELDHAMLEQLFRSSNAAIGGDEMDPRDFEALCRELETIRRNGFAANAEGTEQGVSAVGIALHDQHGRTVGALSVACPTSRFQAAIAAGLVNRLREACLQTELDVARHLVRDDWAG